jgi:Polyketide cyclase / dehydrase and lipid transport
MAISDPHTVTAAVADIKMQAEAHAPPAGPIQGQAGHQVSGRGSPLDVAVTRAIAVPGNIEEVFDFVAAEGVLPEVLTGFGLVPGVVSTSNVTGPWDKPGSNRTVHLAGGSTAHEEVEVYSRPSYFAYRVSDPTFSLRYLMARAHGQWWFNSVEGDTYVRWTYTFRAKGMLTKLPLTIFARTQWTGYMDVCLKNVVAHFGRSSRRHT